MMLADSKHGLLMYRGSFNVRWLKPSLRDELTEEIVHKGLGFKVELKEEIRASDWSGPLLSDDQVVYAC
ncbi:hypothetical protein A2U01_0078133, partial [Trifolium medium]|nr:hypothetical protein [Trifolium medium]